MIFVDRAPDAPASLSSAAAKAKADETARFYVSWTAGAPRFEDWAYYNGDDVKGALRKDFKNKCGYCERFIEKGSFEVEHYRPKGRIEGCTHPGYWWMALTWTNLLPACPPCNKAFRQHEVTADMSVEDVAKLQAKPARKSSGKAMQFPVTGARLTAQSQDHEAEGPLLMDPTRVNPEAELHWLFDRRISFVEAAAKPGGPSAKGRATIDCVGLNRPDLVQARTQILDRLKTQRISIFEDLEADASDGEAGIGVSRSLDLALRRVRDMKLAARADEAFAGMTRAFVADLIAELTDWATTRGAALPSDP